MESKPSDNQPVKVHCKPGQAARINIEIVIGDADDILGAGGTAGGGQSITVVPTTGTGAPQQVPLPVQLPDPDTTHDDHHPIGFP